MTITAENFWTPDGIAAVLRGRWLTPPPEVPPPPETSAAARRGSPVPPPEVFAAARRGSPLPPPEVCAATRRGSPVRGPLPGAVPGLPGGVSIDTRTLEPGQIFLAIAGERFDGHDYVAAAFERGAAMAIVAKPIGMDATGPVLLVDDTVAALQTLAKAWRTVLRESGCRVVGVVGSNGKTTTRELIYSVLQGAPFTREALSGGRSAGEEDKETRRQGDKEKEVHSEEQSPDRQIAKSPNLRGTQSPKSFNNHLGVPLTLLAAKAAHDFVVVEIGSNHPGEIASLAAIAQPDAAVVTSIGHEHLEHFGSLDGVAAEEGAILAALPSGGPAIVEAAAWEHISRAVAVPPTLEIMRYSVAEGVQSSGFNVQNASRLAAKRSGALLVAEPSPNRQIAKSPDFRLPLLGRHNIANALAAIAVGRWMGLDDAPIAAALANVEPVPGRLQVLRCGDITVIHDAYNANPDSMAEALNVLATFPFSREAQRSAFEKPPINAEDAKKAEGAKVQSSKCKVQGSDRLAAERPRSGARSVGPIAKSQRIAILGDMLELGEQAPQLHRQLGERILELAARGLAGERADDSAPTIDRVILIGPLSLFTAQALSKHWPADRLHVFGQWSDDLPGQVASLLHGGDVVLLKASRGMALERLLPAIKARGALKG